MITLKGICISKFSCCCLVKPISLLSSLSFQLQDKVGSIREQDTWIDKSRGKQANKNSWEISCLPETLSKCEKLANLTTNTTCKIDIRTKQHSAATKKFSEHFQPVTEWFSQSGKDTEAAWLWMMFLKVRVLELLIEYMSTNSIGH